MRMSIKANYINNIIPDVSPDGLKLPGGVDRTDETDHKPLHVLHDLVVLVSFEVEHR